MDAFDEPHVQRFITDSRLFFTSSWIEIRVEFLRYFFKEVG